MRVACRWAAGIFALFAYLQLNDLQQYGTRSWLAWFSAYAAVAVITLISAWRRLPRPVYAVGAAAAALTAVARAMAIDWRSNILYNESNPAGNETAGLLIVTLWLLLLAWRPPASRQA